MQTVLSAIILKHAIVLLPLWTLLFQPCLLLIRPKLRSPVEKPPGYTEIVDGLIAYYPFNGNANDESGNGNHGIVYGATLTEDRFGDREGAYRFDGAAKIELSNTESYTFSSSSFTLVSWVQFTEDNDDTMIIAKHIPTYASGYFLGIGKWDHAPSLNQFNFFVNNDDRLKTGTTYKDGKWHLVVGVYDNTKQYQYLYVDGSLQCSQRRIYQDFNAVMITIGATAKGNHFIGKIDDVRIYNRALSEAEIQTLYANKARDPLSY